MSYLIRVVSEPHEKPIELTQEEFDIIMDQGERALSRPTHEFQVRETSCIAKDPTGPGEDMVADLDHFVILVDGVTGKDGSTYEGSTGGRFAAETVVRLTAELPLDATGQDWMSHVSQGLRRETERVAGGTVKHPPGTQAAVYSKHRREIWRIGDITVRVNNTTYPAVSPPTDEIVSQFRSAYVQALIERGDNPAEILQETPDRDVIHPLLLLQDTFANNTTHPLGYPVINGTPVPERFLDKIPVPDDAVVTFCSDGYPEMRSDLEASEHVLAYLLAADPLCIKENKGTKGVKPGNVSFDDRSWISFDTGSRPLPSESDMVDFATVETADPGQDFVYRGETVDMDYAARIFGVGFLKMIRMGIAEAAARA